MKGKHCLSTESYSIVASNKRFVIKALGRAIGILKRSDWAKGSLAVDSEGHECSEVSNDACGFSLGGAVIRAVGDLGMYHLVADMSLAVVAEVIGDQISPDRPTKVNLNEFSDTLAKNKCELISVLQKSIDYAKAMRVVSLN